MTHQFDPAHAERLLDEGRRAWHDPAQVLRHLNLERCTALADVGCGPGWFALEAARRVPPGGRVYAVDLSPEMLALLSRRARAAGLENVLPVLAEEEDEWPVPTGACAAALIANVYHEVDPASMFVGEVKRILEPGGLCLLVDWKPEATPVGPPVSARVAPEDVVAEFTAAGFDYAGPCDVGPYSYGLRFVKPRQ
ncbi:SAM-dependent methyltransferase [Symbiobacterium terraclitae]|uniref:SAM-dependent methyltransferase n=1 Tax=Symbiobacterium terraclitae TaxID=557451 RepID=A0ABS4JN43_9FIRM|nr:SAM-dependent methyltransferase [Symbiobacterium terraclitae]